MNFAIAYITALVPHPNGSDVQAQYSYLGFGYASPNYAGNPFQNSFWISAPTSLADIAAAVKTQVAADLTADSGGTPTFTAGDVSIPGF